MGEGVLPLNAGRVRLLGHLQRKVNVEILKEKKYGGPYCFRHIDQGRA